MTPYLIASIVAFVLSVSLACLKPIRQRTGGTLLTLLVGAMTAIAIISFPVYQADEYAPFDLFWTLYHTIKAMGGDYNYEVFNAAFTGKTFGDVYTVFLHLLAPVLTGAILLSLLSGLVAFFRIRLFRFGREIFLFSELNQKSYAMAESLTTPSNKALIIFCNTAPKDKGKNLREMVDFHNWIFVEDNELSLFRWLRKKDISFFEISNDDSRNLTNTMEIAERIKALKFHDTFKIILSTILPEGNILINSLHTYGLDITLINEDQTSVYNLLSNHPLYRKDAAGFAPIESVLIVGGGKIGRTAFQVICWCGLFPGKKINITIIDKDINTIKETLSYECPELVNGKYPVQFYQAEAGTASFERVLKEHCAEIPYIIVTLGNDDINIQTAIFLREHYLRESRSLTAAPQIFVRVTDHSRSLVLKKQAEVTPKLSYALIPFGSNTEVFSAQLLSTADFEQIAEKIHTYFEMEQQRENPSYKPTSYHSIREFLKQSNKAAALHIQYKLWYLGLELEKLPKNAKPETQEKAFETGEECYKNAVQQCGIEKLAEWEHERWMAFEFSYGYRPLDLERASAAGIHKNDTAKLHCCLVPYKELEKVSEAFQPRDFFRPDRDMIENIPAIIQGKYIIRERSGKKEEHSAFLNR